MTDRSRIRVLVVDDEPFIRESLTMFLEKKEFQASSAESAEKALALLSETPYDLAIVDMGLPGMDGDAMVLQALEIQPDMHVFIHTASSDYHLSERLGQAGVRPEHVFNKPLGDLTMLIDEIERVMVGD